MTLQEIKLNQKIKDAEQRTQKWARGEGVDFPCESCLPKFKPRIFVGKWGGRRCKKGEKMVFRSFIGNK